MIFVILVSQPKNDENPNLLGHVDFSLIQGPRQSWWHSCWQLGSRIVLKIIFLYVMVSIWPHIFEIFRHFVWQTEKYFHFTWASFSNWTRQMWHSSWRADRVFLNFLEFFRMKLSAAIRFRLSSAILFWWIFLISPCMLFRRSIWRAWHFSSCRVHVDEGRPLISRVIAA